MYAYRSLADVVGSGGLDGWVLLAQGQMPPGTAPMPVFYATSYMARATNHDWAVGASLAHVFPTREAAEAARAVAEREAPEIVDTHYVFTVEHVSEIVPRLLSGLGGRNT
mgnify:CR=1 FL=1